MISMRKSKAFAGYATELRVALDDLEVMIEERTMDLKATMVHLLKQQAARESRLYKKGCVI